MNGTEAVIQSQIDLTFLDIGFLTYDVIVVTGLFTMVMLLGCCCSWGLQRTCRLCRPTARCSSVAGTIVKLISVFLAAGIALNAVGLDLASLLDRIGIISAFVLGSAGQFFTQIAFGLILPLSGEYRVGRDVEFNDKRGRIEEFGLLSVKIRLEDKGDGLARHQIVANSRFFSEDVVVVYKERHHHHYGDDEADVALGNGPFPAENLAGFEEWVAAGGTGLRHRTGHPPAAAPLTLSSTSLRF